MLESRNTLTGPCSLLLTTPIDPLPASVWDVKDPDDICGICQSNFDGCCASCKEPGDSCPLRKSRQQNQANMRRLQASSKLLLIRSLLILIPASPSTVFGKCSHEFHLHCIMKWLQDNDGCPSCRRPWGEYDGSRCASMIRFPC